MADAWTIRRVVAWSSDDFAKRGIDSPKLDAELLVAHALGVDRIDLYLDLDRPLSESERTSIRGLVTRRQKREPVAYILGYRHFYGRRFEVDARVLIPRPDTETLVQKALEHIDEGQDGALLDLCTGSGIVAVTLAAERPDIAVVASDVSSDALTLAKLNAEAHEVLDRISLVESDLFASLPSEERFSLIVTNPPYIRQKDHAELSPDVRDHEPVLALVGGDDGLLVCRQIIGDAAEYVFPGGWLLMEVGADQAAELQADDVWKKEWAWHETVRDLNGIDRVVVLQHN